MEDRLLKFARIVDAGSFTKAASIMHISQPALTTAVKKLERELGAELLIRGSHALSLTASGRLAYHTAKNLQIETQNLQTELNRVTNRQSPLCLGLIDSLANTLFVHGNYLHILEKQNQLSLSVDNSARLIEHIQKNTLDLALIAEPGRLPSGLSAEKIAEEPLVIVTHAANYNNAMKELRRRHITHFLSYNQASRTAQIIEQCFARKQISLEPNFYSTSPELILQILLARRGTAVLPYLLIREQIMKGLVTPLPVQGTHTIMRTIMSVHRTGRAMPADVAGLLQHTRQQLRAQVAAAQSLKISKPTLY